MKKFLLKFFLIILNIIPILNIIVLPFQIKTNSKNDEKDYFIYTYFEMGEPPQKINCEINKGYTRIEYMIKSSNPGIGEYDPYLSQSISYDLLKKDNPSQSILLSIALFLM